MKADAMTTPKRLAAAQKERAEVDRSIATLQTRRSDALIADDDNEAAAVDVELVELRAHAARVVDKIALLGSLAESEAMSRIPEDPKAGDELLTNLVRRMMALEAKPHHDRSAADDAELDNLRCKIPYLKQHIEISRKAAA
jgi:hypothetical protein